MATKSSSKRVVLKKVSAKKASFTKDSARKAARKAKKAYAKISKRPSSWQPGGREWAKVLGHFGAP